MTEDRREIFSVGAGERKDPRRTAGFGERTWNDGRREIDPWLGVASLMDWPMVNAAAMALCDGALPAGGAWLTPV